MKRILSIALVSLVTVSTSAQFNHSHSDGKAEVPAYNAAPPPKGKKMNPILSGAQLTGPNFRHPAQVRSYKEAAKIAATLHQLPCYCHCDRNAGHNSLRTCFETEHGANCSTCMQETLLAAQMLKQGKTAKQIRDAIIKGEHQKIDLNKITSAE